MEEFLRQRKAHSFKDEFSNFLPVPVAMAMYEPPSAPMKIVDKRRNSMFYAPWDANDSDDDDEESDSSDACLPEKCYQCEPPRCPGCPPCPCKRECNTGYGFGCDARNLAPRSKLRKTKYNKRATQGYRRPETINSMWCNNKRFKQSHNYEAFDKSFPFEKRTQHNVPPSRNARYHSGGTKKHSEMGDENKKKSSFYEWGFNDVFDSMAINSFRSASPSFTKRRPQNTGRNPEQRLYSKYAPNEFKVTKTLIKLDSASKVPLIRTLENTNY